MKVNTLCYCSKSWSWPEPPTYSLTDPEDNGSSTEDTTWSPNWSTADLSLPESMEAPIHAMCALWAEVEGDIKKWAHNLSLADEECDRKKPNKKQMVLWNPTLAQLLEKTNSYQSRSSIRNNYLFMDDPALLSCNDKLDPHISFKSLVALLASLVDSLFAQWTFEGGIL